MNLEELRLSLELLSYIIAILGLPLALIIFFRTKRKERLDRENGTYSALNDKYIEFLNLCLENPHLYVFEVAGVHPKEPTGMEKVRQYILFEILTSLFEKSFIMYKGLSGNIRKAQWRGWHSYINDWMKNPYYRQAWRDYLSNQYEEAFLTYMNEMYVRAGKETAGES